MASADGQWDLRAAVCMRDRAAQDAVIAAAAVAVAMVAAAALRRRPYHTQHWRDAAATATVIA